MNIERISLQNGVACYECASVKRGVTGEVRSCYIDLLTGAVHCDCPSYSFHCLKKARQDGEIGNVATPKYQCRHLMAAVGDCIKRGEIVLGP